VLVAVAFFQRPGGCHLFPFSFDTALAVAAITWALLAAAGRESARGDRVAAIALAAALLSRPELGLAAIAALALERRRPRRLFVPALLPLAAAGVVYAALSAGTLLETLRREGWLAFVGPPQTFRNIYASYAGLDRSALRLAELAWPPWFSCSSPLCSSPPSPWPRGRGGAAPRSRRPEWRSSPSSRPSAFDPGESLRAHASLFPPIVRVVPPVLVVAASRLFARLFRRQPGRLLAAVPDAVLYTAALFALRLLLAAGYVGPTAPFFCHCRS
jgi:hypothetical protein